MSHTTIPPGRQSIIITNQPTHERHGKRLFAARIVSADGYTEAEQTGRTRPEAVGNLILLYGNRIKLNIEDRT